MNGSSESDNVIERLAARINLNNESTYRIEPSSDSERMVVRSASEDGTAIISQSTARVTAVPHGGKGQVAILDFKDLQARGFLTPEGRRSLLAEEYRVIKRPMLRAALNSNQQSRNHSRVALITSPQPRDGKTFTSINLGMSIALEHDTHVLLVDSDMRQRGMSTVFGVADRPGLMDVLGPKGTSLSDVIVRTNVPRLSILPAGQSVDNPTEILASSRMKKLVNDIAHRYDNRFIIFDSPPVLATSESGVLAAYVGEVIMVVAASKTTKQAVIESLALLDACSNVNFILNKCTLSAGPTRFGHYGSYDEH